MDTLKNIVLGLLVGIVICMAFEIKDLKQQVSIQTSQERTIMQSQKEDPLVMFERFFDMVLEFEAKKQAQQDKAQTDEQESTK